MAERTRLQVPEITNRIDAALTRDEKAKEVAACLDPPLVDRMSASGRCYRDRWFRFRGFEMDARGGFASNPKLLRLFRLGHVIEDEVIGLLEIAGFTVKNQQLELGVERWLGHIDGLIDMGHGGIPDWCLLEVKSANSARFKLLRELGSYEDWHTGYAAQIHAYLLHLNDEIVRSVLHAEITDAIVVVYNKDTSELYTERIPFDRDVARKLEEESAFVTADWDTPPDKPPAATSRYCAFCKWCDFGETCWGGAVDVEFDE